MLTQKLNSFTITYAKLGFTAQKNICDYYKIEPNEKAKKQFEAAYSSKIENIIGGELVSMIKKIKSKPVKCVTYVVRSLKEII